jgi:3-hydroxy acid dehydrogenase / malonic semialdehyde reductase
MTPSGTVIITGATSGFGHGMAEAFAAAGWRLILVGRREDRLRSLAEALGDQCLALTLDVRDRHAVLTRLRDLPPPFDAVQVLINNAGLALGLERAQEADLDNWDIMVDTNVKGLLYCTRAVLPGMVSRNQGHIVNVGSVAATAAYPGGNTYGATKAFVRQFSNNLRSDLLGTAIRVTNVEPGLAETEFSMVRFKGDAARAKSVYEGTQPLTAEDVAGIVLWVVSLPPHVNVNLVEVMPTAQAWGPLAVHRRSS